MGGAPEAPTLAGKKAVGRYFAKLHIRSAEEMFEKHGIIERVIAGGHFRGKHVIPPERYYDAFWMMFGLWVNTNNITRAFVSNLPKQEQWMNRLYSGNASDDYQLCMAEHEHACKAYDDDVDFGLNALLVWVEFVMLAWALARTIWGLGHFLLVKPVMEERQNRSQPSKWKHMAFGLDWLDKAASTSALKMLPQLSGVPMEILKDYNRWQDELSRGYAANGFKDKVYSIAALLVRVLKFVIAVAACLFALYLKINSDSLQKLTDIPIYRWKQQHFYTFVGSALQISGLVNLGKLSKRVTLFAFFSGQDAQLSVEEEHAMHKFEALLYRELFWQFGWIGGFVAALTLSDQDLQKIVLTEHPCQHARSLKGNTFECCVVS